MSVIEQFGKEDVHELGKIIVGKLAGRESNQQRILFNPIGMSIHDVSEAYRVYLNVVKLVRQDLALWEHPHWI
ncbi:hypothetical protein [Ammoniphilus sp. YIM 78166]|uniref:hypothetical protein n=1 Tax=Ammoniphilus sp. YIM 78166 TaxID=1644106 RepID=UPI00106F6FDD|nr:hypothetical protein [Ammoniphilus sp. YIM 78166]